VQHRCNQELQSQTAQLLSRLAGLESQLTACRELLRWSGSNSDRDWQRVKAELCLLRQASEAAASPDELLRQLADREERLLEMEARLQSLSPPSSCLRSQRSHRSSNDGGSSEGTSCCLAVGDGSRRKKTLAARTGALKVDCDSWKRRCRTLEAAIASSRDAPDEPTMTSPRASLTSLTATMSRSLAAVDRCRSVSSGDTRGDLRLGHQHQQQQKQQPQKQQALHQKHRQEMLEQPGTEPASRSGRLGSPAPLKFHFWPPVFRLAWARLSRASISSTRSSERLISPSVPPPPPLAPPIPLTVTLVEVETWRHIDGVGGLPAGHLTHLGVARHDELLPRLMRHRPGICRLRGQPGRVFVGPAVGKAIRFLASRGQVVSLGLSSECAVSLLLRVLLSSCRCCFSCINSLVDSLLRLLRLLPRLLWHLTRPRVKLHTGSHYVPSFAGLLNDEQRRAGSNSGAVLGGDAIAPSLLGAHSLDVEAVNSRSEAIVPVTDWLPVEAPPHLSEVVHVHESHRRIRDPVDLAFENNVVANFAELVAEQAHEFRRRFHHGVLKHQGGALVHEFVLDDAQSATTVGAAHVVAGNNLVEPSVFQTHIGNHEAVLLLEAGDLRIFNQRTYDHVIVRVEAYSILVPGHSRQRLPVHGALQCHLVANKGKSCLRSTTTRHFVSTRPSRFSATTRYSPSSSGPAESISSECTPVSGSLCSRMPRREYRPSGLLLKYQATSGAGCPEIRQVRRSWEPSATVSSISGLRNVGASPNGLRRSRTQRTVVSNVCVPLTDSSTGLGLVALSVTVFSSIGGGGGVGGGKGGNGSARAMQLRTPSSRGSSGSIVQVELPPPVLMLMRGGLAARRRSSRNQVTSGVGSPSNSARSCSRSPSWRAHTPSRFSMSYSKFRRNIWPSLNHWMSGFGEPFTLHCSSSGSSWLTRAGCSSMVKAGGHSTRSRQFVSITPVGSRITQAKVPASSTVTPSQATDVKPSWSSRIHLPPILLVGSGRPLRCHSTSAVPLGIAYSTSREQGEPSVRVKSASSRKNFRSLRTDRVATLSNQSQSKLAGSASSRPRHSGSCVFSSSMKAYSFSMNCSICKAKQIKTAHPEDGVDEHLEELQLLHELLPFGLDWLNVALKVLANSVSSFFEQRLHLGPNFLRLRSRCQSASLRHSLGHNLCLHRPVLQLSQPVHHAVNFQVQVPQPQQQARFIHSSFLFLASRPAFSAMRATSTESPSRTIFCRSMSTSWNRLRISSLAFWCSLMRYSASGMELPLSVLQVALHGSIDAVSDAGKGLDEARCRHCQEDMRVLLRPVRTFDWTRIWCSLKASAAVYRSPISPKISVNRRQLTSREPRISTQACVGLPWSASILASAAISSIPYSNILPGLQDAQLHLLELFSQPNFDVGEILADDDEDLLGGQDLLDALALQEDLLVEILGIAKHPLDLFQFALRIQQLGAGPVHPVENAADPVLNLLPGEVRLLQVDAVLFDEDLSFGSNM
uniref:RUN domain-containing protein n=1 Tax=Macrostomum lignano TaxID=282301 RepID=A0A1I8JMH9_9PLAT